MLHRRSGQPVHVIRKVAAGRGGGVADVFGCRPPTFKIGSLGHCGCFPGKTRKKLPHSSEGWACSWEVYMWTLLLLVLGSPPL